MLIHFVLLAIFFTCFFLFFLMVVSFWSVKLGPLVCASYFIFSLSLQFFVCLLLILLLSLFQIYVFFPEGQVGAGVVKNLAQRLKADNIFSAIVVAQNRLTAQAKHGVEEVNKLIRMEVFEVNTNSLLIFNSQCLCFWKIPIIVHLFFIFLFLIIYQRVVDSLCWRVLFLAFQHTIYRHLPFLNLWLIDWKEFWETLGGLQSSVSNTLLWHGIRFA